MTPVSADTSQNELPLFDEVMLCTQLGGDRNLAKTIVISAMGDIPDYLTKLEQAVVANNWNDAQRLAHTIKGLVVQIGGTRLAKALKDAIDSLKAGTSLDSIAVANLRGDYQLLAEVLMKWLR